MISLIDRLESTQGYLATNYLLRPELPRAILFELDEGRLAGIARSQMAIPFLLCQRSMAILSPLYLSGPGRADALALVRDLASPEESEGFGSVYGTGPDRADRSLEIGVFDLVMASMEVSLERYARATLNPFSSGWDNTSGLSTISVEDVPAHFAKTVGKMESLVSQDDLDVADALVFDEMSARVFSLSRELFEGAVNAGMVECGLSGLEIGTFSPADSSLERPPEKNPMEILASLLGGGKMRPPTSYTAEERAELARISARIDSAKEEMADFLRRANDR